MISDDGTADAPVACTLTLAGQAAQAGHWHQVAGQAMTERARTQRGIRICFRAGPGVEDTVRQLAAMESECCSWATWTVHRQDAELILEVGAATEEGVATLHEMLNDLWPEAAGRR